MAKGKKNLVVVQDKDSYEPLHASLALGSTRNSSSTSRTRNSNANLEDPYPYKHIADTLVPFKYSVSGLNNTSDIDIRDAVILCQKAYYGFAIFRNTIDLMTEFSCSDIYFKGGNKASRDFFTAYFNKINLNSIQDRFFREYFRSGNVFIYKMNGVIRSEDVAKFNQVYGATIKASKVSLPLKYLIINPADIQVGGSISFASPTYYKVLSDYELERLRKPITEEDQSVFDSLAPEIKKQIQSKSRVVLLPLDLDKTSAIFYKKQDYEPFSVPMGFPVLADINWKAEMKKMDMVITRTMQQAILLVTMGESPKDGGAGVNQAHLQAIQQFFQTESVARVLIADYTTKASFVTPDIGDLLDPKKYAQVDNDIKEGLNNLLIGGDDKFANATIKIQVFIERLRQARQAFKNEFLLPEIKATSQTLGFKVYPEPFFQEIDFKDELEFAKLYTRLMEIGVLTAEEGLEAFENGKIPSAEDSVTSQTAYKGYRDKGLYEPLTGGPATQKEVAQMGMDTKLAALAQPAGRPKGTKAPQSKKKMTPIGGAETFYSLSKITDNLIHAASLESKVKKALCKLHKIKKLNDEQTEIAKTITNIVIANEAPEQWETCIADYIDSPVDQNSTRVNEIQSIAAEHSISTELASILYISKSEEEVA